MHVLHFKHMDHNLFWQKGFNSVNAKVFPLKNFIIILYSMYNVSIYLRMYIIILMQLRIYIHIAYCIHILMYAKLKSLNGE